MASVSTTSLMDALRQYRLLEPVQLEEVTRTIQAHFPDSKALARELIQRGWLTPYQANQLLQGKGQDLVLGSYILLEKLGEGGMGQVFKGRNWKLGRIVALKLIRKERLSHPDAVRRFEREVRAAAALSHPNIVHAHDADHIGGTHLLVMEYVEGATDLAKLVKQNGPLPVPQAREYIRQAALGLQHAYERGMVHRDIKPANLLLTTGGKTVKVLDMGLARLDHPANGDDDKSSTMTQEGSVMGTPDYIAPEQALDTHTVDIRADLYSLGCTFYYLLTGRVPFPGGTLLQKLNKHQNEEPLPVEKLRPEVPPEVARVVRKLMAKKPVDRYQTPAELAAALATPFSPRSGIAVAAMANDLTIAEGGPSEAVKEVERDTLVSAMSYMEKRDDTVALEPQQPVHNTSKIPRWLLVSVGTIFFVFVGILILLLLIPHGPAEKKPPSKREDPLLVVIPPPKKTPQPVDDAWLNQVAAMPAEKQVEAVAAKLKELNPGFDGKVTHKIEGGMVTDLTLLTDNVTDLEPVRGLKGLKVLSCPGSDLGCGTLWDLSSLRGLALNSLNCFGTSIKDLSPLQDMRLIYLNCDGTQVSDLSPLKGMPLFSLHIAASKVKSLAPLRGMELKALFCDRTEVSDLSPLQGMPLDYLTCNNTRVVDLSPLKTLPLRGLVCDFKNERDAEILRSIKTLETINYQPVLEFWKRVDEKK